MDPFTTNSAIWSKIYESGKSNLSFPNENLVRLCKYLFGEKDMRGKKLLDYGFGSGNNLTLFCDIGFDVYGLEVSQAAKDMSLKKLGPSFPADQLIVTQDRGSLPYTDNMFDVVVSWQVLYYNSLESLHDVLSELHRVIKPGGTGIFTMCRIENTTAIKSHAVGPSERVIDESVPTQAGAHIIVSETEEDLRQLFKQFKNLETGFFISSLCGATSAHWVIYGSK